MPFGTQVGDIKGYEGHGVRTRCDHFPGRGKLKTPILGVPPLPIPTKGSVLGHVVHQTPPSPSQTQACGVAKL